MLIEPWVKDLELQQRPCLHSEARLWSLWDVLKLNSEKFLSLLQELHAVGMITATLRASEGTSDITFTVNDTMRRSAKDIVALLGELSLLMSLAEARRLETFLEEDSVEGADLERNVKTLSDRIHDEIGLRHLFVLSNQETVFYTNIEPFGVEVTAKFPDARKDLEEASKCLALERSSACVFHLMCAIDLALQKFSKHLKSNYDPKWDWNKVLESIKAKIDAMPAKRKPQLVKKEKYLGAYTHLHGVRGAWRNPAMHSRRHYDTSESQEVFNAVGAFMRDLTKIL